MRRCVIWGAAGEYEHIINQVKFEEWKGNVQCVAVLSKSKARYIKKFDGYPLIRKEDLKSIAFDYLIIPQGKDYAEIKLEALALGIPDNKIISSRVFQIPCFDFKRYASLRENPVTILSNDCWGGLVYRELDLPLSLFRKVLLGYNFGGFHKSTLKQQESCAIIGSTNRNLRSC